MGAAGLDCVEEILLDCMRRRHLFRLCSATLGFFSGGDFGFVVWWGVVAGRMVV